MLCLLVSSGAGAAYPDDIHFTQLQAELGGATPNGTGVAVSQVEAAVQVNGQNAWMVDPWAGEFGGKTLIDRSGGPPGLYSAHATSVGKEFYGTTTSIAPGITDVSVYWADQWVYDDFLHAGTTGANARPLSSTSRVGNHSWAGAGQFNSFNAEVLRRLDWVIETDDFINVVAQGPPSPLLASGFNSIAAGRSDGGHVSGTVVVDSLYGTGRTRPDLVVPAESISQATPRVAAAAALLVQTGHGNAALSTDPVSTSSTNRAGLLVRNAERVEVVRAALMAGADRVTRNSTTANLALYRSPGNQSGNGLDSRYGAGQLNIRNSYHIITAGEQNSAEDGGPGSGTASAGFDYDPRFGGSSGTNTTATYALPVSATPRLLTAALVTNVDINGTVNGQGNFSTTAYFRDLSLSVIDVASSTTVYTSQSTVDNTENAWLVVPANAQYALRVTRASTTGFNYHYGITWQLMNDTDADGAYDAQDNCINAANGPIVPDAGGYSQLDADGDGYGNMCDGDLNNSGSVTSSDYTILKNALNTSDPNADLNGSGLVTISDYSILRAQLNEPPGPSAYGP